MFDHAFSFQELLILILLGALFFKEQLLGWIGPKLGFKNGGEKGVGEKVDQLAAYYNHDTTKKLDELIDMHNKTHQFSDKLYETMKDLARSVDEIMKYGVSCREKK